jgi:hypothetical protein
MMANGVSPELALVDSELAALLRATLPDPGDCLAPRREPAVAAADASRRSLATVSCSSPANPVAFVGSVSTVQCAQGRDQSRRPVRREWRRTKRVTALLVLLGIAGLPFFAFRSPAYPRLEGSSPAAAPRNERVRSSAQASPSPVVALSGGPGVEKPSDAHRRVLSWPKAKKATLYNVVFISGKKRVDRWVRGTSTMVRTAGPGRQPSASRLRVYRWYVYPLYGAHENVRFGKLLAHGSIRLPQAALGK